MGVINRNSLCWQCGFSQCLMFALNPSLVLEKLIRSMVDTSDRRVPSPLDSEYSRTHSMS